MIIKWSFIAAMVKQMQNKLYRLTKRYIVLVFMTLIFMYLLRTSTKTDSVVSLQAEHEKTIIELQKSLRQENGTGCEMPKIDPFSKELEDFIGNAPKIVCRGLDWVECHKSECFVIKQILNEMKDVACVYRDIIYINDHKYEIGPPTKTYGEEKYKLNISDHVKVSCSGTRVNGSILYGMKFARWLGYKAGFRPVPLKESATNRKDPLSVMILCFDSTSHNGFLRNLPISYSVLTEELNATVLNSYNIVGDATTAALFPILTGRTESELPDARIQISKNFIDQKQFIFHHMKENGYRTAYFEGMPWIGTFQSKFNGFQQQPADHYLRALLLEERGTIRKWWNGQHCIGAVPQYALMLNLSSQFFELDGNHYCFTMIDDICHDDFNLIRTAENELVSFLRRFRDDGRLENTMLIVMGDHGTRFSALREIYQGRMEERLPFVAVVLPEKLRKARPDAVWTLRANRDVLTTPFDLHSTVLDVVGMNRLMNDYKVPGSNLPRAMSLLRKIPKSRTCADAGIVPHWCACAKWYKLSNPDPMFNRSGQYLEWFINDLISEHRNICAERKLLSIEWVLRYGPNTEALTIRDDPRKIGMFNIKNKKGPARADIEIYQAKVILTPGRAIFEGTMTYNVAENVFLLSGGDISRVNAYADEPWCVRETNPHLNKYCYCIEKFKKERQL